MKKAFLFLVVYIVFIAILAQMNHERGRERPKLEQVEGAVKDSIMATQRNIAFN